METSADPPPGWVFALNRTEVLAGVIPALAFLVFLLFLSALVSGAESAFAALTDEEKKAYRPTAGLTNRLIGNLISKPKVLLATLVTFNTLTHILTVAVAIDLLWHCRQAYTLGGVWAFCLILFSGFAIVFFGEVMPKVYAQQNRAFFLRTSVWFVTVAVYVLSPFTWLLLGLTGYIEKRLHRRGYSISVEAINQVLESDKSGAASAEEKSFLRGIANFGMITAKHIMQPRLDITALPQALDFHELMDKINKSGYSRIPVHGETIDNITGILYIKDLLPHLDENEDFDWHPFLRPPYFITENKRIGDLLHDFQGRRVHIAIVVDEYGGTAGLVTLEDIMEEIVGEIRDETDGNEQPFIQIDAHTYVFESKILLNDFCKSLEINPAVFEKVRGNSESLGGLLLELFARLPQTGEKTDYASLEFVVLAADTKKIKRVKVTVK